MKSSRIISALFVLIAASCSAQIKNIKTENVKIYGNCGMCKTSIEVAGNIKKIAQVDWNKETKMATISYDSLKITNEEILKRIALIGYDSETFLAPDDTYDALPECCQYDRAKPIKLQNASIGNNMEHMKHSLANDSTLSKEMKSEAKQSDLIVKTNPLLPVYNEYFSLKDALISSDASSTAKVAVNLLAILNAVKMNELEMDVHMVWMKIWTDLKEKVQVISESDNIETQRKSFVVLSDHMYSLMKISPVEAPIYYQHCPMANDGKGANWLSKENVVKNPYFGAAMLACGKTVETIK